MAVQLQSYVSGIGVGRVEGDVIVAEVDVDEFARACEG
jgi:hypothetical protein